LINLILAILFHKWT